MHSLYSLLPAKYTVLVDQETHVSRAHFSLPHSIRQYELKIHEDLNMNKIYIGELGRLKSFENQKPYVIRHHSTCVGFFGVCSVPQQQAKHMQHCKSVMNYTTFREHVLESFKNQLFSSTGHLMLRTPSLLPSPLTANSTKEVTDT